MSDPDPIGLFADIFARAASTSPPPPADHTAVALATATALGRPSIRIVLMRQFDSRGFVFFTNYESRKAGELEENPRAALCFYWHWIEEQIRVEGTVVAVSAEESDRYFASRPRGSQLGAWASRQSRELEARARLEHEYREIERRYEGTTVPRPPFWGGYRLVPDRIEFWKAGNYRLHDRLLFARDGRDWQVTALYP